MTDVPQDIRRFETLQLVSIMVGLLHEFAIFDDGHDVSIVGSAVVFVLTLLVSRQRKNWARWVLFFTFVLGAAAMLWNVKAGFTVGYPVITIGVTLTQGVALALLFTKQSSHWLLSKPSAA